MNIFNGMLKDGCMDRTCSMHGLVSSWDTNFGLDFRVCGCGLDFRACSCGLDFRACECGLDLECAGVDWILGHAVWTGF